MTTVYIIDDDEAVRDSLQALLEAHDFSIEGFESGTEFLAVHHPELKGCVILDINLPELDGFEILERMGGPKPDLPVIMISARADPRVRERAAKAGVVACVSKPFSADDLIGLIRSALQAKPAHP